MNIDTGRCALSTTLSGIQVSVTSSALVIRDGHTALITVLGRCVCVWEREDVWEKEMNDGELKDLEEEESSNNNKEDQE